MTKSLLSESGYTVLGEECTYQGEDGADFTAYCSDGLIRGYTVSTYSSNPCDGASYSGYWEENPKWKTRDGKHLTVGEMSKLHRIRVTDILHGRLLAAKSETQKAKLLCYIKAFQIS